MKVLVACEESQAVCKSLCQYGWYDHAPKGVPRSVWRSKTAPGIARAMAEQWGCC